MTRLAFIIAALAAAPSLAHPAPERRQSRLDPVRERQIERRVERINEEQERRERYRALGRHEPRQQDTSNDEEDEDN